MIFRFLLILTEPGHQKSYHGTEHETDEKRPLDTDFFPFPQGFGNHHGQHIPQNKQCYDDVFVHASRNK